MGLLGAGVLLSTVGPAILGAARAPDSLGVEVMVRGLPRPVHLDIDGAGRLVVLSHGWQGDAAAEIYRFDLKSLPVDASASPRMVIPFSDGPRKAAFGSLAVDPRSGDLFLGEENGNRIYRLSAHGTLALYGVGLNHLVGGSSLAFDLSGRLLALDYTSPEEQLRSEAPPPAGFEWLSSEAYHGPVVFRLDPEENLPLPRRLDLVAPVFPRGPTRHPGVEPQFRFISVVASPTGDLVLLNSVGELLVLAPDGSLRRLARLPAGHYHRTHMAVGPDGSVFVSSGFQIRLLYRVSAAGGVTTVAQDLGDPGGISVDRAGRVYVAEAAHHRIIRITDTGGR